MSNNDEWIIQKTSENWFAHLSTANEKKIQKGSLILTKNNLIFQRERGYGGSKITIPITDILNVDFETRFGDVPKIVINLMDTAINIEFSRHSTGHSMSLFGGDLGSSFIHSELSAFTSYWASLITMTKFQYGEPELYEAPEEIVTVGNAWCGICKKYVNAHSEEPDTPVWKLRCPECGQLGMTTLSPEDRQKTT